MLTLRNASDQNFPVKFLPESKVLVLQLLPTSEKAQEIFNRGIFGIILESSRYCSDQETESIIGHFILDIVVSIS